MKEFLKEFSLVASLVTAGVILVVCIGYFIIWIANDPFNIIPDSEPYVDKRWELQKNICVEKGGTPIQSAWNGQIKECRF